MTRIVCTLASLLAAFFLAGCSSTGHRSVSKLFPPEPPAVINDVELRASFVRRMGELIKQGPEPAAFSSLTQQLSRTSCELSLPAVNRKQMDPAETYKTVVDSVVVVGSFYHCKREKCKELHNSAASGVIIHEDGAVLTNYHVVDTDKARMLGMAIMTFGGDVYLVDEVLAADESNDVAILKLRDAAGLPAVPIFRDEPVGRPVTVISHPVGRFYTLTHGYVSRYCESKSRSIMNITADYARGSSGGPIFNDRGDLVGLVSSTVSLAANSVPLTLGEDEKTLRLAEKGKPAKIKGSPFIMNMSHQMTVKKSVPSRAILDLIVPRR